MRWYVWMIIIILVIATIYIIRNRISNKKLIPSRTLINVLNGQFGDILSDSVTRDPKEIVEGLINMKYSFEEIKNLAAERDVIVLRSTEIHTMEFNPRRVILEVIQPNCLAAPCNEIIRIQSIG